MADDAADCQDDTCRVLIVEDNPDVARLLERAIETHGHQTEVTRNGTEALGVATRQRPHIALIDIGLPGLDGIYVARELRRIIPDSLLVAVTGRDDPETVRQCLAAGFDHHYSKPIELDTVIALLDDWKARSGCAA
jgi:CheY-like chemotaxis protein